jgi:hypothetical protein
VVIPRSTKQVAGSAPAAVTAGSAGRAEARRGDRGALTPFVMLLCLALVALLALVADGSRALSAREATLTEAEQAARVGTTELSIAALHSGSTQLALSSAVAAADYYMAAEGHPGSARITGGRLVVTVAPYPLGTPLLAIVGIDSIAVTATASADVVIG